MSTVTHRLALVVTLLAHVVAALLVLALRPPPAPEPAADALLLTWIEPAPDAPAVDAPALAPAPAEAPVRSAATADPRPRESKAGAVAEVRPEPPTPEPLRPLSAVFIEQGKALARSQEIVDFARNPLDDRASGLDAPAERIRMREPMSAARVVAGIGQLFGGPGYETSPCPRIRRNIAALGPGGDRAALQEEVRRYQQHCE
jgi:hypothetical protein